ncbi:MAG: succinate dehydrogenase, cytochrome b556 subunit [Alphaproteobacteria bacterium]|nr:succinate dehydrogenase, cytochrome b556 subunit [Alphaproteobacteria bacterium]HCO99868.1 succinate dehydrogenase, cytochrome b556 subunit [Rhodospirillaceae bacterium]
MATDNRPLSPHLQVYRPQLTSVLSILHRATGILLTIGTLLLVWWLIAVAAGPTAFDTVQNFIGSIIGQILLLGWCFAFYYHMCNGIRHLVWDTGRGFELTAAYTSGWLVVAASVALTAFSWIAGYATLRGL